MNIKVGDKAEFSKTISESDVYLFAGISGDFNAVHINAVNAGESIFGKRIAHGFLAGSLISAVIGMKLPGSGTIYMEQDMHFMMPVYIGDTLTAVVSVEKIINEEKRVVRLSTVVVNQGNEYVIKGYAIVKAPLGDC